MRLHPANERILLVTFARLIELTPNLNDEDVFDWTGIIASTLSRSHGEVPLAVVAGSFRTLAALSRAKSSQFKDLDAFIAAAAAHSFDRDICSDAIALFMNVLSMNSVDIGEDFAPLLAAFFASALELLATDIDAVQTACFLVNLLADKYGSLVTSKPLAAALIAVLRAQVEEFGGTRTCIRTLYSLSTHLPDNEVFSTDKSAQDFGEVFMNAYRLLEENQDGLVMLQLQSLTSSFLQRKASRGFQAEAIELKEFLVRYDSEDLMDNLMLSDEDIELFVNGVHELLSLIEQLLSPLVDSDCVPVESEVMHETDDMPPAAVHTERNTSQQSAATPEISGADEITVEKFNELINLVRHFQDHASVAFQRAELVHKLFTESTRKVESLLRENIDLRSEVRTLKDQVAGVTSKSLRTVSHSSSSKGASAVVATSDVHSNDQSLDSSLDSARNNSNSSRIAAGLVEGCRGLGDGDLLTAPSSRLLLNVQYENTLTNLLKGPF